MLKGLPKEIANKIGKTKQTRGAQPYDRVVYQNRVNRNNIAVVPYFFRQHLHPNGFENGHVFLVRPHEFFEAKHQVRSDFDPTVQVGKNAFVYYDNRRAFNEFPPLENWTARKRGGPGEVVYRMPATTATDQEAAKSVVDGEPQGIRFFEYASSTDMADACTQLALLAWKTIGIETVADGSGPSKNLIEKAKKRSLWDEERLEKLGVISKGVSICPLCKRELNASEMMSRVSQAEGREVVDLTITEVNLFHMEDLKPGEYNHRPYMLGWGHHHCNAVARDHGIEATLDWMAETLRRNHYSVEKTMATDELLAKTKSAEGQT